ncbi:TetR/AcrR family transcriptional regulator [Rhodococcus sp. NPDC003382]
METLPSRREEYALRTYDALVEIGADLFATQGYANTSIEQIARTARVTKGAVYHHFSDKQALFAEAFGRECAAALDHALSALDSGPDDVIEAIVHGLARIFDEHAANPRLRALSQQATSAIGEARRREVQAGKSVPVVRELLEQATRSGTMVDIDEDTAARMILELGFYGLVSYADNPTPETRTVVENTLGSFIRGLSVRPR